MWVAIPYWQRRVSPVFDVATHLYLVRLVDGEPADRRKVQLASGSAYARAEVLADSGVSCLICGAISRPQVLALEAAGIEVMADICGEVDSVMRAYADGTLRDTGFLMPGCCARRGRRIRAGRDDQPENQQPRRRRQRQRKGAQPDAAATRCVACGRVMPNACGPRRPLRRCPECAGRPTQGRQQQEGG